MQKAKIAIFAAAALCLCRCAYAGTPKTGDPAPGFAITKILQADRPALKSPDELKGKTVVLEFWDTTCAPCVAAIPHMNDLYARFKDKPVIFIAVTGEGAERVSPFLKEHPISGWIGLDEERSSFDAFGVRGTPSAIIIDAKGNIAARTYPTLLTADMLAALLAGKSAQIPVVSDEPMWQPEPGEDLVDLHVRISSSGAGSMTMGEKDFQAVDMPLVFILSELYHVGSCRILADKELLAHSYDVSVARNGTAASLENTVTQAFALAFNADIKKEKKKMSVYLLKLDGKKNMLKRSAPGDHQYRTGFSDIVMHGTDFSAFPAFVEDRVGVPVVDETGLKGAYDMDLKWDKTKPESIHSALKTQLGFKLVKAEREISVYRVSVRKTEHKDK